MNGLERELGLSEDTDWMDVHELLEVEGGTCSSTKRKERKVIIVIF